MNAKAVQLNKELVKAIKEITLKEPEDVLRMRTGHMDPPAGSWNQYFTNHIFADGEIRALGYLGMTTVDHCLRDDAFTMKQVRIVAGFLLPFGGEFLSYAGLRTLWGYVKRFIDLVNECDEKKDLIEVCRSLMIYVNYTHAWTHLYAPWGSGGTAFNFQSAEELKALQPFAKAEKELKKDYPYDRQ
jgi:hypothetical protein